jgi:hypothetical protein
VPIYRDLALARALNELPEGEEIPEALYEAVAELLRVLWEIDRPTGVAVETDSTRASEDKAQGNAQDKSVPSTPATWKRV